MTSREKYAQLIKQEAARLGFLSCGISTARYLEEEAPKLEAWLSSGFQGEMNWLENHFDKRLDPTKLVPGAKSVVSVLMNYFPSTSQEDTQAPRLAKYAYGEDYHFVVRDKLRALLAFIHDEIGDVDGRAFVDSAPVMERSWARLSGLGWIGKHGLLLSREAGSFYFIGELIIDLDLEPDHPTSSHCGTCTRCIDACPTDAIVAPEVLDSSRCISYLTIELKDQIPQEFSGKMENWVFGCDICQDVCPWNRFSKPHSEARFNPHPDLIGMDREGWYEITEEVFRKVFKGSAVKRTKYSGLKRNLEFLKPDRDQEPN